MLEDERARIAICVLDDHPMIAEGVRRMAEQTDDLQFAGAAETFEGLKVILETSRVDVAILDVKLGNDDVETVCKYIRTRFSDMNVLILSSLFDNTILRKTFAAGAKGYALKNVSLDRLPVAIRQVHSGTIFISPEILAQALLPADAHAGGPSLGSREKLIIEMIGSGKTNKEIARFLGLSHHTVKLHVSRLLKRFRLTRRSQLVKIETVESE